MLQTIVPYRHYLVMSGILLALATGGCDAGEPGDDEETVPEQFRITYTLTPRADAAHSGAERTFFAEVDDGGVETDADGLDGTLRRHLPLADLVRPADTAPEWTLSVASVEPGGGSGMAFTWDFGAFGSQQGRTATFRPEGAGWVDGRLLVEAGGAVLAEIPLPRLVSVGAPAPQPVRYGVMDFQGRPQYAQGYGNEANAGEAARLMAEAGADVLRVQWFWEAIEPVRGQFDFAAYDAMLDLLEGHGLAHLAILAGSARWNTSGNPNGTVDAWLFYPPQATYYRDFGTYCRTLSERYRDRVSLWEIWNEPNGTAFWPPSPDPAAFAALLKQGWLGIKYGNPEATVVLGGLQGNGLEAPPHLGAPIEGRVQFQPNFLPALYDEGAQRWWDVVAVHPYVGPEAGVEVLNAGLAGTLDAMEAHGDESPLWITENGWPRNNYSLTPGDDLTPAEQGAWMQQVYTQLDPRVPVLVWFAVIDPGNPVGPGRGFGLLERDGSTPVSTAAYDAYRALAR